jgi:hypothetical protein
MKSAYRVLAHLVALGVVVQAMAIAFAWFGVIHDVDGGATIDASFEGNAGHAIHGMVGMNVLPLVALVLLIVSFFAKVPGGVKWAAIVFGLTVLQVVLAFVAFGAPVVGALHGLNALALFAVAVVAGRRVRTASPALTAPPAQPTAAV